MNIIITILIILGGLVALFFIIALLTKRDFSIEKQITINRPRQDVFNYIKLLKSQEQYSVWVLKDPNIKLVYTGTDGTIGAMSSWESKDKNVGVGEQEIKKMTEGECIEVEIRFKKPFEGTNNALTTLTTVDGGTNVTNRFYGRSKFPMNVMNLVIGKMLERDMQQNLVNMKNKLEQ